MKQQIKIGMRVRDIEGPVPAGLVLVSPAGWRFETAAPELNSMIVFIDGSASARGSIGMWIVVEDTRKPQAEAETPKHVDRPRWAPEALMAIAPITDKQIERALPRSLSGNYPTNIMSATLRRLADTEVALAHARAEIVGLKARAILEP